MTAGDGHDGGIPSPGTPAPQAPSPATEPPAPEPQAPPASPPYPGPPTTPACLGPAATPAGPAPAAATPAEPSGPPVLALHGATKSFGAVHAVTDGTIDLYAGEAHALLGENGAGKSTMVKLLAGVYQPDSGELLIDGEPVSLHNPADAQNAGIAVIYQEPTLFPDLSVAENIFMGRQPLLAGRRIDRRRMHADSAALFSRLGVKLDPGRIGRGLTIADQQIVEIAKALSLDARVIVMDEPTAALSATEVARLFDVVATLRSGGSAILFISHRLEEVFEICQRVTVMRDGRHVLTSQLAGVTADAFRDMVGREMVELGSDRERGAARSCSRSRDWPGKECSPTSHLSCERARSSLWPGWSGRAAARSPWPCSASTRHSGPGPDRGRPSLPQAPRPVRWPRYRLHPRGPAGAWVSSSRCRPANIALRPCPVPDRRPGRCATEREFAATAIRLTQYGRLVDPVPPLRRQPAEGRAGKWLGRQPARADPGRADPGHRRRCQGRRSHRLAGRLVQEGVAIILISSDLPEVMHHERPDPGHARGT